jgi:hypothetical protein
MISAENCLLGQSKKIAKFLMGTCACRSTFLYGSMSYYIILLPTQDFRIERDKWKLLNETAESVNAALLRQQQQRLAILRAVRVLFTHQNSLRHVLKQIVFYGAAAATSVDSFEEAADSEDLKRREVRA